MEGEEEEVPTAGSVFVVGRKKSLKFFLRKRKKRKRKWKLPS
jgi:ribosomal protein L24E